MSRIEEAHHESIQRTRGGSVMDAATVVENSRELLAQIDEDLDETQATLDLAERDRMVAKLHVLDKQAAEVGSAEDVLDLARAVHRFVKETPALADLWSEEMDVLLSEEVHVEVRDFEWEDFEGSPEDEYVWEVGTGIRNRMRNILSNLEESPQKSPQKSDNGTDNGGSLT